ncbi:MAG: hypothetical protein R2939_09760 [Kofleriaceae bacterium]
MSLPPVADAAIEVALEGADRPRSPVPKVVGILLLVFGGLGLVVNLRGLLAVAGTAELFRDPAWRHVIRVQQVDHAVSLAVAALQVYAGFRAVTYRQNAPRMAALYAWTSILTTVALLAYAYLVALPALDALAGARALIGAGMMFAGLLAIAWPIVVLALMSRPAARAACSNPF